MKNKLFSLLILAISLSSCSMANQRRPRGTSSPIDNSSKSMSYESDSFIDSSLMAEKDGVVCYEYGETPNFTIEDDYIVDDNDCLDSCVIIDHSVKQKAFYGNRFIEKLVVKPGCTTIDDECFFDCVNLREIYFFGAAPAMGYNPFGDLSNKDIQVFVLNEYISGYRKINDYNWKTYIVYSSRLQTFEMPSDNKIYTMHYYLDGEDVGTAQVDTRALLYVYTPLSMSSFNYLGMYRDLDKSEDVTFYFPMFYNDDFFDIYLFYSSDVSELDGFYYDSQGNINGYDPEHFNHTIDLFIDHNINPNALVEIPVYRITIGMNVNSIGDSAFGSCPNLYLITFEGDCSSGIGKDVFAGTWDREDFAIYVPSEYYMNYKNIQDEYWQFSIVEAGKLFSY